MANTKVILSKDLPGGRVTVPSGSEQKSYYKYYLEPMEDISDELKQQLRAAEGGMEDTLELDDRAKLQDAKCWPPESGIYPLKKGGLLVASNVKAPDITGEAIAWWAAWHGLDPLRYALWDPEDHYGIEIEDKDRARALDPNVPVREKLWGMHHKVLESFDKDEPEVLEMWFQNPWEYGYDKSLDGTDRCQFILCAKAVLGGKIPVFMTENFCKGEDGENEVRLRFWIGYNIEPGSKAECKLPPFVKVPKEIAAGLMIHNFREYKHINKFLPSLYEEEKDNWE